jgi:hypothetical protein
MTLVLSLITVSWAIQVSDRKLVWLDQNNAIVRKDDHRNKAVLWCNRLAFAYTGLAELGPMREATDEWLARELRDWWVAAGRAEQRQDQVMAAIADRATAAIQRPRIARSIPRHQRLHAFVGTGWARFDGAGGMAPYIGQIHNFPDPTVANAAAKDTFGVAVLRLPEHAKPIQVSWLGQDLEERERSMLEGLRTHDPSSRPYGEYAATVMVDIVRSVADRNELVGRGLLINSLPKWAIRPGDPGTFLIAGPPEPDQLTFLYVPPDEKDPVLRAPRYVCEDREMANFEARGPTAAEIEGMFGPA